MPYDLSALTAKAMVDRAIALARAEESELIFDLSLLVRQGTKVTVGATTTDANLDAITAEVVAVTTTVAGLAAGELRDKYERRLRRLTERKSQLTDRLTDFDGVVQVDNEFDRRRLGAALAETITYLAELAAHKATLAS